MKKSKFISGAGGLFLLLAVIGATNGVSTAQASITAISITGGDASTPVPGGSAGVVDGWQFSLDSAITVTDLGYYDHEGDGLGASHDVGIFMDTGALLFSSTVTPGDALDADSFRYTAITPTILSAGTYRIGAFRADDTDQILVSATGLTVAAPVTYITSVAHVDTAALAFPDFLPSADFQPAAFGPNFKFHVPEPATIAIWSLLGLVGLGLGWRRRRAA